MFCTAEAQNNLKRWILALFVLLGLLAITYAAAVIRHGFSAADQPSALERVVARAVRNIGIPRRARYEKNPLPVSPAILAEARQRFEDRCSNCHGDNGNGQSNIGQNLYPKAPDLRLPATQNLTDGEIHYIIKNGVRLTGMPAWGNPHIVQDDNDAWKLVLFVRSIAALTPQEHSQQNAILASAHYVGSGACQKCHAQIYERWKKTPMANVVRDPREHPEAIIPDLATNNVSKKFTKEDVAFVYGSIWKQRYFTKIGDDYFPEPAQWEVGKRVWRPYFVRQGSGLVGTLLSPR